MKTKFELKLASTTAAPGDPVHPTLNPAVARCCAAYNARLRAVLATSESPYSARREAGEAYRHVMPPLDGAENIRNFIACVAHGMLVEAISVDYGSRLLYAAQVANSVQSRLAARPDSSS